jgi:galactokinase
MSTGSIRLSLPARVNILGNPSDGNEGDFATISAAVELRARAVIERADGIHFEQPGEAEPENCTCTSLPLVYNGQHNLLKGAVNRLYAFSAEFREKLIAHGFRLRVASEVPRQSGLGGSSLFVLLALAGLRELYQLDRRVHNNYLLSELTQRVEARDLGIACGYADRYVPLFGGLAYLDYRGKLLQHDVNDEPYTTYERLDSYVEIPRLVAAMTGVQHDSGDIHGRMRPRYLAEYAEWQASGGCGELPPMVRFMSGAYETAWRGKIALLKGDLQTFGRLMNRNHQLVDEMMLYCGFEDGAGWANNLFIRAAHENGALGAKLTGAGGGGSVFALVGDAASQSRLQAAWERAAAQHNLPDAQIYVLQISNQGLIVE